MRNPELRDKSGLTEAEFLARYNAGDYERPSVAADMVISPQMAVADSGVMTGTGTSGGADLTAGIVAALKDVLGDQKGQQGDLVIPVYLGNQLLDEVIVTAQQRMSLRSGGR